MFKVILGPDAELRLLELHHADALFALIDANRRHLRKWREHLVDQQNNVDDAKRYIDMFRKEFAGGRGFGAGIWFKNQLAGVFSCYDVTLLNRAASLGFWLGENYQGHGLVTRACRATLDYAVGDLGLNRLEMRCATGNTKSRAVAERLSFKEEGTIRDAEWLGDRFVDHVIYGMLARDWSGCSDLMTALPGAGS